MGWQGLCHRITVIDSAGGSLRVQRRFQRTTSFVARVATTWNAQRETECCCKNRPLQDLILIKGSVGFVLGLERSLDLVA